MNKYQRREQGYKTDYPDGVYEVVHIIYWDLPIKDKHKHSRVIEIKDGYVICPPIKDFIEKPMPLTQDFFFEVNEVIDSLPSF